MTRIVTSIPMFFILVSMVSAQTEVQLKKSPEIALKSETVDFGTVLQGTDNTRELLITNLGNAPLIISKIDRSCGCTTPEWPKAPVKPGDSAVIKVKYDTKRLGPINKTITIHSNTEEKVVRVVGKVVAAFSTFQK